MEKFDYNGRKIYTSSHNEATVADLEKAKLGFGVIEDAYFFRLTPGRFVERVEFDIGAVERQNSGLMVNVRGRLGVASVSIAGLERITGFLVDSNAFGKDLSTLKGRPVLEFYRGISLLGIGL